jgi:hypothetical protein
LPRRFRHVLASIAADLGGVDRLSEGQKQIARRCAMLSVECEIMPRNRPPSSRASRHSASTRSQILAMSRRADPDDLGFAN